MKPLGRRDFTRLTAGTLAASVGPFFLFPDRALANRKTLRIAQWTHFLPEYDQWFDGEYVKQWGDRHDTTVIVDHVPVDRISARAAREVAAGAGHDLFMFPWPPAMYQQHAIDHTEIYQSVSHRHGNTNELGHKSSFNPATGQYFAFVDSWIPFPVHYFGDYWSEINTPYGPTNYDTLRAGSRKIRAAHGIPCGLALAPGLESNITLHSLLWAFRTSIHDEDGNVTINSSYMTIQALKYVKALYNEGGTREALTWGPAGRTSAPCWSERHRAPPMPSVSCGRLRRTAPISPVTFSSVRHCLGLGSEGGSARHKFLRGVEIRSKPGRGEAIPGRPDR